MPRPDAVGEKFYVYHPGSSIGQKLVENKHMYISHILLDTKKGIKKLVDEMKFGQKNEFWDDFIFLQVFAPLFDKLFSFDIEQAIDLYSEIDHLLFTTYIRRDEDPVRFRRAFWNVNNYGLRLARSLNTSSLTNMLAPSKSFTNNKKRICFVFKGGFQLAHSEFFQEFLVGSKFFRDQVEITLFLIDERSKALKNRGLEHINIVSTSDKTSPYDKLMAYRNYMSSNNFDHISWVACVQNLSLYMGQKSAPKQSYWSMKYHSIVMDSLDKYAGLGFGGKSFYYDDVEWFRGRAFPSLAFSKINSKTKEKLLESAGIPINSFVIGCFVRSEKLNNDAYWNLLEKVIAQNENVHFVLAAPFIPEFVKARLKNSPFKQSFHHLGWVNTKQWCQCLDLYLDSFPRGSCLTILEAIKANIPSILFDSEHNRESSALPYLSSALSNSKQLPPGVLPIEDVSLLNKKVSSLIKSKQALVQLAAEQKQLLTKLEGQNILFAKDYLNYLLDANLSIRKAQ
ncbi:hypothetical protein [Synechococcus sp. MU1611]|uniref:hypothetical protein n=1 Tax=Synechococcus sp. MU1611 TaxID=2508345 RepID=UPI001CF91CF9|nr:hypothetical protein [Synechococcus sp. MU1611]MCB4412112.1 hypothetical protein [Synechococcus sp. MU1611]